MRKNELCTLSVTGMTAEGNGVARGSDGTVVFVPGAAPGDVIRCRIVKVTKSRCYGIIDSIVTPSPDRIESGCPVSDKCGGCAFRQMSYPAELAVKERIVRDAFERIGGFCDIAFEDIVAGEPDFYRNKAVYPIANRDGAPVCGFYSRRSHRVVPYTECRLQPEIFGRIAAFCLDFWNRENIPAYDEETGTGVLRHLYLRRGHYSGEIMLCFVVKNSSQKDKLDRLAGMAIEKFPDIKTVVMNVNSDSTNVILGNKTVVLRGSGFITDVMCGKRIEISPESFYQVNTPQAERLYGQALEYAALSGTETVLDLYCGAGTIGLSMADKAGKIIGCEIVPEAVLNARQNAAANGIRNAEFFQGDAGEISRTLAEKGVRPDVIVIDPPRKGCDNLTLDSMVRMSPERIVMISCDPATAARDARYLRERGYSPVKARAFDLFPRTGHVETAVLIEKHLTEKG